MRCYEPPGGLRSETEDCVVSLGRSPRQSEGERGLGNLEGGA